jgi:hypothetical protein
MNKPMKTSIVLQFCVLIISFVSDIEAKKCIVSGKMVSFDKVKVSPKGSKPFFIGFHNMPATAEVPYRGETPAVLHVSGPISFVARSKIIWLEVLSDFSSPDGMVKTKAGATLHMPRSHNGMVEGSPLLYARSHKMETASFVRIPAYMLTLDLGNDIETEETNNAFELQHCIYCKKDDTTHQLQFTWWEPRNKQCKITLFSKPKHNTSTIFITTRPCGDWYLKMRQVGFTDNWILLEYIGYNTTIKGWIPRSAGLENITDSIPEGYSIDCCGDDNYPGGIEDWIGGKPSDLFEGMVQIRAGTKIFSKPPKGEWAITTTVLTAEVRYYKRKDTKWVELRVVPGLFVNPLFGTLENAWVPIDSIYINASDAGGR